MNNINDYLKQLRDARIFLERSQAAKKAAVQEFENSEAYQNIKANLQDATDAVSILEMTIKNLAEDKFLQDNVKSQPGYTVKTKSIITLLDTNKIKEWCFTNFRPALVLDTKAITDAAKNKQIPADFYSTDYINQVQISSNLDDID